MSVGELLCSSAPVWLCCVLGVGWSKSLLIQPIPMNSTGAGLWLLQSVGAAIGDIFLDYKREISRIEVIDMLALLFCGSLLLTHFLSRLPCCLPRSHQNFCVSRFPVCSSLVQWGYTNLRCSPLFLRRRQYCSYEDFLKKTRWTPEMLCTSQFVSGFWPF